MIQSLQQPTTFDEFIEWLLETSECRYELHRGVVVEMPKLKGKHSDVAGFLTIETGIAIRVAKLPYFVTNNIFKNDSLPLHKVREISLR